jgi:hypothetical protein
MIFIINENKNSLISRKYHEFSKKIVQKISKNIDKKSRIKRCNEF